jgi:hypothetical protein
VFDLQNLRRIHVQFNLGYEMLKDQMDFYPLVQIVPMDHIDLTS